MTTLRAFLLAAAWLLPALGTAATVTLNPTADAYVRDGSSASKNFGSASLLQVQTSATAGSNYDSYLKFDTSSASGPIASATLRLYASLSKAGNVSTSAHAVADNSWGETTIKWNNKPAMGAALGGISTTSTTYAWKDIDVTSFVQSERNAGRNVLTLGLHNGATSTVYVRANSRNASSNKPQLVIVTAPPNVPPTVSLTSPAAGSSYSAPASVTLAATASDSDGSIAKVEFYQGAALIGTATTAPYSVAWTNVPAGSYSLTARAYDNLGAATTSAPVNVTVSAAEAHGVFYIYADHLNTPRVITDTGNKVVWRWDSDAYGTSAASDDPDGDGVKFTYNQRFPGQYFDRETGLHYNYFRDYDPGTGRYVQADPIGIEGGINLYAYVENNPLSMIDPLGLAGCFVNFPDYPITVPGTSWQTTLTPGHAGALGYDSATGATRYYEYGRYDSDFGNVRRQPVPDLKIGRDGQPTPESMKALQEALSRNAGKGTRADLTCEKDIDEKKMYDYAEKLKRDANRPPYSWKPWASNTCRDFARRALDAGRP